MSRQAKKKEITELRIKLGKSRVECLRLRLDNLELMKDKSMLEADREYLIRQNIKLELRIESLEKKKKGMLDWLFG